MPGQVVNSSRDSGAPLLTAIALSLIPAFCAVIVVGFYSINFTSLGNVTLRLERVLSMQGRVLALWWVAFLGTTPLGGSLIGAIGQHAGSC